MAISMMLRCYYNSRTSIHIHRPFEIVYAKTAFYFSMITRKTKTEFPPFPIITKYYSLHKLLLYVLGIPFPWWVQHPFHCRQRSCHQIHPWHISHHLESTVQTGQILCDPVEEMDVVSSACNTAYRSDLLNWSDVKHKNQKYPETKYGESITKYALRNQTFYL